jgi:hypothetical protein
LRRPRDRRPRRRAAFLAPLAVEHQRRPRLAGEPRRLDVRARDLQLQRGDAARRRLDGPFIFYSQATHGVVERGALRVSRVGGGRVPGRGPAHPLYNYRERTVEVARRRRRRRRRPSGRDRARHYRCLLERPSQVQQEARGVVPAPRRVPPPQ